MDIIYIYIYRDRETYIYIYAKLYVKIGKTVHGYEGARGILFLAPPQRLTVEAQMGCAECGLDATRWYLNAMVRATRHAQPQRNSQAG